MAPKKKPVDDSIDDADRSLLSVEDFNLPKSMILRLAKGVLPPNTSVQKDAVTAILKSTTLFINYLASNADERAQLASKKTIRPEDVFGALEEIEFGHFKKRVEQELNKYQEVQNNKRNDYRRRLKEEQRPSDADPEGDSDAAAAAVSPAADRDKSTTPLVVTLGNGDRDRERSSLRFNEISRPDDTETEPEDEAPAAKKARMSIDPFETNGKNITRDEDDTLSEVDDDVADEEEPEGEDEPEQDDGEESEDVEDLAGLTDIESDDSRGPAATGRRRGSGGMNPDPDDAEDEEEEEGFDNDVNLGETDH